MLIAATVVSATLVIAMGTAWVISSHLFPTEPAEAAVAAILHFVTLITIPMTIMGFIGQFYPLPVAVCSLVLDGAAVLMVRRMKPFPSVSVLPVGRLSRLERTVLILLSVCVATPMALSMLTYIPMAISYPVGQIDVSYVYLPNILNFVQKGTVWDFNAIFSYFPFGYELSLSWSILFLRNYALLGILHFTPFLGFVGFALLILTLILRKQHGKARLFAVVTSLALLVNMYTTRALYLEILKSDILGGLGFLGGAYYLMRFWAVSAPDGSRDNRPLVLVGLCAGLMLSAKLTNVYFIAVFALGHGAALIVSERHVFPRLIRRGLLHALAVAAPLLILAGPWLLRTVTHLDLVRGDSATVTANQTRLIDLYAHPTFVSAVPIWLPSGALFVIGAALLAGAATAARRSRLLMVGAVLGAALLLAGYYKLYVTQGFLDYVSLQTGPYFVALVTLILILALAARARAQVGGVFIVTVLLGLAAGIVLAIAPYGAGVRPAEPPEFWWRMRLQYRYSPAFLTILIIILCALGAHLLRFRSALSSIVRPMPWRRAGRIGTALFGVALIPFLLIMPDPAPDRLPDFYENHTALYTPPTTLEATSFFSWVTQNVQGDTIYALNIPSGTLYGRGLSNRVLYTSPGYAGTDGQQRYRYPEVVTFVEQEKVGFIAVSFIWNDVIHGALAPTDEVKAELAKLRQTYRTVYDDGQYVVLATPYARYAPVDHVEYRFNTLAAPALYTVGFLPPEAVSGGPARWTGRKAADIRVDLSPGHLYQIRFHVVASAESGLQNSLSLSVNGQSIALERETAADGALTLTGTIPREALNAAGPAQTTLTLTTDRVVADRIVNDIPDTRGVALDWLTITAQP